MKTGDFGLIGVNAPKVQWKWLESIEKILNIPAAGFNLLTPNDL
jgi:hypothetical protein